MCHHRLTPAIVQSSFDFYHYAICTARYPPLCPVSSPLAMTLLFHSYEPGNGADEVAIYPIVLQNMFNSAEYHENVQMIHFSIKAIGGVMQKACHTVHLKGKH